jgi:hypothetical protein
MNSLQHFQDIFLDCTAFKTVFERHQAAEKIPFETGGFPCKMTMQAGLHTEDNFELANIEAIMKLVLLGTGGFLPTDAAQTACYFLPEVNVMLDAGSGTFHLPKYLQRPELDIYLSHAHGDHTSGLVYLFASYFKADWLRRGETLSADNISGFVQRANEALPRTRIHADENTLAFVRPIYAYLPYQWFPLQEQEPLPEGGILTRFLMEGGTTASASTGLDIPWPISQMSRPAPTLPTSRRSKAWTYSCTNATDLTIYPR